MGKKFSFMATMAAAIVAFGVVSCNSDPDPEAVNPKPEPEPEPLVNAWEYDSVRTAILNVATEARGDSLFLFLNKNVPLDEESQYGVNGQVQLMIPTASLGTEITCSTQAATRWAFDLLDTEKDIEIISNVDNAGTSTGGTLKVEKTDAEYIINGKLNYADGKTLEINYKGAVTDLVAFNNSVHNGTGKLKWTFNGEQLKPEFVNEDADRPVTHSFYKFINFKEGAIYSIFLYTGNKTTEQMITDWNLLKDESWGRASIHNNAYNPLGVTIFIPTSFANGRTIELSQHANFADFTERRLPWGIYGMFGNVQFTSDTYFQMMFYSYEDKVKLGAATLNYDLKGTMKITKTGSNWDIVLENIARDTDLSRHVVFSGEYHGTIESWSEYGKGAPRIWLEEWINFGINE
jgi:hypothetical protein